MIAGLDSSFTRPTLAQARQAYAAGYRAWGGYLVSDSDEVVLAARARHQGLHGLAAPWTRDEFAVVQEAGLVAIGFCSGWDDPDALRAKAAAWDVLSCVDAEKGIRDDHEGGNWVPGFVVTARCGLYGAMSVHYETAEPTGRGALFNILAWYPGYNPYATWFDAIELRPPGPCAWQWQGTHDEFGIPVDSLWLDDWFHAGAQPEYRTGGFLMGSTMGGFRLEDVDHCFETSVEGDVLWGRTGGGSGGHVHVGFWNLGGSGPGPVVDLAAWPSPAGARQDIIIRTKYADGSVLELVIDGAAPDQQSAVLLSWYQPDNAGPFRVPAPAGPKGDRGPQGEPGKDGPSMDEVADEVGKRIVNG